MNHKVILFLLATSVLICFHLAQAQQLTKVPRIGYLSPVDAARESARSEGIRLAAMWMSSPLHTRPLFLFSFMTFLLPDQRETCCYAWHGTRPSHLLAMRPSLGHKAPGSLSQGSNRQEFFSPGSVNRRVAPWGDVSSWVKGAE